jgi:hypothetical protein
MIVFVKNFSAFESIIIKVDMRQNVAVALAILALIHVVESSMFAYGENTEYLGMDYAETNDERVIQQLLGTYTENYYMTRLEKLRADADADMSDYFNELCQFTGTTVLIQLKNSESSYLGATKEMGKVQELEYLFLTQDEAEGSRRFQWIMRCLKGKLVLENVFKPGFFIASNLRDAPTDDEIYTGISTLENTKTDNDFRWSMEIDEWDGARNSFLVTFGGRGGFIGYSEDKPQNNKPVYDPHIYSKSECGGGKCLHWLRIPSLSSRWTQVARINNFIDIDTKYTFSFTTGISNTQSQEVTTTVQMSISSAFGCGEAAYGLTQSWSRASSKTFERAVTETITIDELRVGTYIIYQLAGTYNSNWNIRSNVWRIVMLDSKKKEVLVPHS